MLYVVIIQLTQTTRGNIMKQIKECLIVAALTIITMVCIAVAGWIMLIVLCNLVVVVAPYLPMITAYVLYAFPVVIITLVILAAIFE